MVDGYTWSESLWARRGFRFVRRRTNAIFIWVSAALFVMTLLLVWWSWSTTDSAVDTPSELLLAKESPLSDERPLTKEETIGLIFRADAPICVLRKANPEAQSVAMAVLANPKLGHFHPTAAHLLGFVCGEENVGDLEADILRRAALRLGPDDVIAGPAKGLVRNLCMALAIMDRRGIEGASSLLRRMTTEQYWSEHPAVYFRPGSVAHGTDADTYRLYAAGAYIWTLRTDADAVAEMVASSLSGNRRRVFEEALKGWREGAVIGRARFDESCPEETLEKWRANLLKSWNHEVEDPKPSEHRVFPHKC